MTEYLKGLKCGWYQPVGRNGRVTRASPKSAVGSSPMDPKDYPRHIEKDGTWFRSIDLSFSSCILEEVGRKARNKGYRLVVFDTTQKMFQWYTQPIKGQRNIPFRTLCASEIQDDDMVIVCDNGFHFSAAPPKGM